MNDAEDRVMRVAELKAPLARVWRALTDHEEFGQWFRVRLDGPFRPGEVTQGVVTYPGHEGLPWRVRVERMEPQKLFSFSWHPYDVDPETDLSNEPTTLVEFRLEAIPEGTRLTITESGFSRIPDPRRLEALRSNGQGWEIQARNIAQHVGG